MVTLQGYACTAAVVGGVDFGGITAEDDAWDEEQYVVRGHVERVVPQA